MFKPGFWSRLALRMRELPFLRPSRPVPTLSSTSQEPPTTRPILKAPLTPEEQKALLLMLLNPLLVSVVRKVLEALRDSAASRMYQEARKPNPSVSLIGVQAGKIESYERWFLNMKAAAEKKSLPPEPEGDV